MPNYDYVSNIMSCQVALMIPNISQVVGLSMKRLKFDRLIEVDVEFFAFSLQK